MDMKDFYHLSFLLLDEDIYMFYCRNIKGYWLRHHKEVINLIYGISFLQSKNFEHIGPQDFQIKDGEHVLMAIYQATWYQLQVDRS